jgi:hypothetical protein
MKYTKEERKKFYREAYNLIKDKKEDYICIALTEACTQYEYEIDLKECFPEFASFCPGVWNSSWFGHYDNTEARNQRLITLLLCIAMCE